jgi:hypothetical protein
MFASFRQRLSAGRAAVQPITVATAAGGGLTV